MLHEAQPQRAEPEGNGRCQWAAASARVETGARGVRVKGVAQPIGRRQVVDKRTKRLGDGRRIQNGRLAAGKPSLGGWSLIDSFHEQLMTRTGRPCIFPAFIEFNYTQIPPNRSSALVPKYNIRMQMRRLSSARQTLALPSCHPTTPTPQISPSGSLVRLLFFYCPQPHSQSHRVQPNPGPLNLGHGHLCDCWKRSLV